MTWLEVWIVAVVHVGAVAACAYPVLYAHYADWRKHRVGRVLMFKARVLAALYAVSVLNFWWPFPGFYYIYAVVLTLLALALTRQTVALVRMFYRGRNDAD